MANVDYAWLSRLRHITLLRWILSLYIYLRSLMDITIALLPLFHITLPLSRLSYFIIITYCHFHIIFHYFFTHFLLHVIIAITLSHWCYVDAPLLLTRHRHISRHILSSFSLRHMIIISLRHFTFHIAIIVFTLRLSLLSLLIYFPSIHYYCIGRHYYAAIRYAAAAHYLHFRIDTPLLRHYYYASHRAGHWRIIILRYY